MRDPLMRGPDKMADQRQPGTTVANPVIAGFRPDRSICPVGADYYLASDRPTERAQP
jgi:beta-xylosidase